MTLKSNVEFLKNHGVDGNSEQVVAVAENVMLFLDTVLLECRARMLLARRSLGDKTVEPMLLCFPEVEMVDDIYTVWDWTLPRDYCCDVSGSGQMQICPPVYGSQQEIAMRFADDVASGFLEELCNYLDEFGSLRIENELGIVKPECPKPLLKQRIENNKTRLANYPLKNANSKITGPIPEGTSLAGNPKHIEIVKQGSDAIRSWRLHHPKQKLNLRGADFRDANLEGADLSDADLLGVDFSGANLVSSDMRNATLVGANFANANLRDAKTGGCMLFVPDNYEFEDPNNNLLNRSR